MYNNTSLLIGSGICEIKLKQVLKAQVNCMKKWFQMPITCIAATLLSLSQFAPVIPWGVPCDKLTEDAKIVFCFMYNYSC